MIEDQKQAPIWCLDELQVQGTKRREDKKKTVNKFAKNMTLNMVEWKSRAPKASVNGE